MARGIEGKEKKNKNKMRVGKAPIIQMMWRRDKNNRWSVRF